MAASLCSLSLEGLIRFDDPLGLTFFFFLMFRRSKLEKRLLGKLQKAHFRAEINKRQSFQPSGCLVIKGRVYGLIFEKFPRQNKHIRRHLRMKLDQPNEATLTEGHTC